MTLSGNMPLADIHKFGASSFPRLFSEMQLIQLYFTCRMLLPYYQVQEKIQIKGIIFLHSVYSCILKGYPPEIT